MNDERRLAQVLPRDPDLPAHVRVVPHSRASGALNIFPYESAARAHTGFHRRNDMNPTFGAEFLEETAVPVYGEGGSKWMDPRTGHIYYGDTRIE